MTDARINFSGPKAEITKRFMAAEKQARKRYAPASTMLSLHTERSISHEAKIRGRREDPGRRKCSREMRIASPVPASEPMPMPAIP